MFANYPRNAYVDNIFLITFDVISPALTRDRAAFIEKLAHAQTVATRLSLPLSPRPLGEPGYEAMSVLDIVNTRVRYTTYCSLRDGGKF